MTRRQRHDQLDAMLGALRGGAPMLDDVTRARVGNDLQAALREPARAGAPRPPRQPNRGIGSARWAPLAGAGAGFAAAVTLVVWAQGATRELPPPPSPTAAAPTLPYGRTVTVSAGETARVAIADGDVTVYGPGRVAARAADDGPPGLVPDATVDADAVLVDRTTGHGPWSLRYGDVVVRATHATFALDRTSEPRVTVMRGGLVLVCAAGERDVYAGQTATCTTTTRTPAPALRLPSDGGTAEP